MKKTKKLIAIIIAMVMVMINIIPIAPSIASITEDSNTSSITVTGLEAGVTVTAYKIIDVNYDYTADQPSDPMYSWANDAIESWVSSNYSDYADVEDFANVTDADTLATFYSELAAAIKSDEVTEDTTYSATTNGTATYPVTEDVLTESVTLLDVEMGQYLLVTEGGYRVYQPATASVIPSYDEDESSSTYGEWILDDEYTAEVKSTTPSVTKTLSDGTTTIDNYNTIDTISYIVEVNLPSYASEAPDYIVLTDTMSVGETADITYRGNWEATRILLHTRTENIRLGS